MSHGSKAERAHGLPGRVLSLPASVRYGVAIGAAVAAILLRLATDPVWGTNLPFITLFPAIMLGAWLRRHGTAAR